MKVLDNQTNDVRSQTVKCYVPRGSKYKGLVNIFVSGMGSGDEIIVEALLPDNSGWIKVAGDANPILEDGLYVFEAGSAAISLRPVNTTLSPVSAWIEPETEEWRDEVRFLGGA